MDGFIRRRQLEFNLAPCSRDLRTGRMERHQGCAGRARISWKIIVWNSIANANIQLAHSIHVRVSTKTILFFFFAPQQRTLTFSSPHRVHSPQRSIKLSKSHGKFMRKISPSARMRFSLKMCLNRAWQSLTIIFRLFTVHLENFPRLTRLSDERGSANDFTWRNRFLEWLLRLLHNLILANISFSLTSHPWTLTMTTNSKLPKIYIEMFTRSGEMYFENLFFEKRCFVTKEICSMCQQWRCFWLMLWPSFAENLSKEKLFICIFWDGGGEEIQNKTFAVKKLFEIASQREFHSS